jgi:hypothetical protein
MQWVQPASHQHMVPGQHFGPLYFGRDPYAGGLQTACHGVFNLCLASKDRMRFVDAVQVVYCLGVAYPSMGISPGCADELAFAMAAARRLIASPTAQLRASQGPGGYVTA